MLGLLVASAVGLIFAGNALAPPAAESTPAATPMLDEAQLAAPALQAAGQAVTVLFALGIVLALVFVQRMAQGKLRCAYPRISIDDGDDCGRSSRRLPYLETTLLFLVASTLVGVLASLAARESGWHWLLAANGLVVLVLGWPLARGSGLADLRRACGWNAGAGLGMEVGCGLLAYLASLPVLAVGLGLTLALTRLTGHAPYHPIVDWLRNATTAELAGIFLVAVLWAPVVEESLFRGAFYHYLRGRFGVATSVAVVSLAFAAIHPQGLAGIPFLATLAAVLAVTREWRDSILASITLHMVHNGLATALLVILLS